MDRFSLPDDHVGSRIGSAEIGLGVDWLDTRTMETKTVEHPARNATRYITDGHGAIRVMAVGTRRAGQQTSTVDYLYRRKGASGWEPLASYDSLSRTGFEPVAVDRDLDVAYGFMKKDGRRALYSIALDGSLKEAVAFARDDVDVDRLLRIGRHGRVVGASYATTYRSAFYFDPAIERLVTSLASALPTHPGIRIVDSNVDESQLLVHASRDDDPGVYYIFDRAAKHLQTFLVVRPALEGVKLANERPITYRATDGTEVPGYLTLPYGQPDPKGIPAIVMPHGGPSARDEWGFNWLAQYFAARGFAVLQPNYRGSSGYGDTWFQRNGFKSWPTAISDVLDGGRWLVSSGLADPAKLAIVGWSYGGYAALQSGVVDASVFKAIVAIAPVTDLDAMKEQHRRDGNFALMNEIIGGGALARDGSPALNAKKITVPVLMFHGTIDINVPYAQSVEMMDALGPGNHQLVTYDDLDHQLDDSVVRADLLGKSDAFLRQTLGLH
jgi:dipeptidyl aminopeptidase/acylaminoacyl peptidase